MGKKKTLKRTRTRGMRKAVNKARTYVTQNELNDAVNQSETKTFNYASLLTNVMFGIIATVLGVIAIFLPFALSTNYDLYKSSNSAVIKTMELENKLLKDYNRVLSETAVEKKEFVVKARENIKILRDEMKTTIDRVDVNTNRLSGLEKEYTASTKKKSADTPKEITSDKNKKSEATKINKPKAEVIDRKNIKRPAKEKEVPNKQGSTQSDTLKKSKFTTSVELDNSTSRHKIAQNQIGQKSNQVGKNNIHPNDFVSRLFRYLSQNEAKDTKETFLENNN